jgi:hypothetical protein
MKKIISRQFKTVRYILLGFMLFFSIPLLYFSSLAINDELETVDPIFVIIIFEIIMGIFLLGISLLKVVQFDSNNLIITKGEDEKSIPLKNIHTIKMTIVFFIDSSVWKIKYLDIDKTEKSVRLLPNANFLEFKELVELKNDDVKIKNWSSSFD